MLFSRARCSRGNRFRRRFAVLIRRRFPGNPAQKRHERVGFLRRQRLQETLFQALQHGLGSAQQFETGRCCGQEMPAGVGGIGAARDPAAAFEVANREMRGRAIDTREPSAANDVDIRKAGDRHQEAVLGVRDLPLAELGIEDCRVDLVRATKQEARTRVEFRQQFRIVR